MKPYSEACERNRGPILDVLRVALAGARRVLEIGSGTGQHAVYFGANLPFLTWQPSDPASGIRDFESVDALAQAYGFALVSDAPMPANNRTLVWRRLSLSAS